MRSKDGETARRARQHVLAIGHPAIDGVFPELLLSAHVAIKSVGFSDEPGSTGAPTTASTGSTASTAACSACRRRFSTPNACRSPTSRRPA